MNNIELNGLDIDEFMFELERHFFIRIWDHDASKIRTVGELFDYICDQIPRTKHLRFKNLVWDHYLKIIDTYSWKLDSAHIKRSTLIVQ